MSCRLFVVLFIIIVVVVTVDVGSGHGNSIRLWLGVLSKVSRKPVLSLGVRNTSFLTSHVVDPLLVTRQARVGASLEPLGSEVEPSKSVTDGTDFIRDTSAGGVAHLGVKLIIGDKFHQVTGNSAVITRSDEETIDLVLDLDGDTTLVGHDDGNTSVESFRDLDLETFTGGKLEDDVRVGNDGVEKLIVGVQTHDANVLDEMRVVVFNLVHGLVINDAAVRIINGTVSATREVRQYSMLIVNDLHNELRNINDASLVSSAAELSISVNDGGNTLGGVESSNLGNVLAVGVSKLSPITS